MRRALDRYILTEWTKAFCITLAALVGILILEDMYKNCRDFIREGVSFVQFIHYYLLTLPCIVPTVLPMTLLLSLLFVLGNFHRNNEITAMRACGLSLWQMTRPIWTVGLCVVVTAFVWNNFWLPIATERAQNMRHVLRKSADKTRWVQNFTFNDRDQHCLCVINQMDVWSGTARGLTLYFVNEQYEETSRIFADKATFNVGKWTLMHGFSIHNGLKTPFLSQSCDVLSITPKTILALKKTIKELSFGDLKNLVNMGAKIDANQMRRYQVRYYAAMLAPLGTLLVIAIAIPFAISGVRTNPMVGVSKAIGLFFGFYFINSISRLLGEQALLPTLLAAILPYLLMFWLTRKLYRQMTLF